jgi:carbon-monoxide dehydrogenase medium subunit
MEHEVANARVREVGTLGGNLCFSEPHADPGILLLALNAELVAEKASSNRAIPTGGFFVDAYETCLERDEILTEIRIPAPSRQSAVTYMKFGYLERPSVGVALFLELDGARKSIADARIAVGCAGPFPRRVEEAEGLLKGKGLKEASALLGRAGEIAGRASDAMSDIHGSAEYKEHIVAVLLKRAFDRLSRQ